MTSTPTTMLTTTVRGSSTRAFLLRSRPNRPKTALMPMASSTPRPTPTTEPTRPTTPASSSTDRATWRRLAPIARSRASSRLRWATRIEKVLTMRNAPTVSAMPAKTRRKVVTNDSASSMRLAARAAVASPVAAWVSDGSTFATAARSSLLAGAGCGGHPDLREGVLALEEQLLRLRGVEHDDAGADQRRPAERGGPHEARVEARLLGGGDDGHRLTQRGSPTSWPSRRRARSRPRPAAIGRARGWPRASRWPPGRPCS